MMTSLRAPASLEPSGGYSSFGREPEDRLAAGQIVGAVRYRVVREIGHGGMAVVYEAEDLRTGQAVALKVVARRLADRDDASARYHNEARLAAALGRHPHVVQPLAVGRLPELHDRLYLVTELVRGRSLGAVVLETPRGLPVERVCRIGRDVARALVALHERGIVHRDVKPGNVMLEVHEGHERARLLDFGCAYATGDGGVAASADLTQAHERVGSPVYMAPEQALGLRPTPGFDIYALGATLYELITGVPPYAGSSKAEIVRRKCATNDPPLPVMRVRDGVPRRLAALVDGCLAREASNRPASAVVVLRELEGVMIELGLGGEVEASRTSSDIRWRWLGAAMVLLLVGTAALVSFEFRDDGEDERPPVEASSPEPVPMTEATPIPDVPHAPKPDVRPVPEPIPEVEPDPRTPAAKAQPPRPPEPCPDVAAKAQDASHNRDWSRVLQLTKSSRCWNDAGTRLWLRVEALSELRLFDECVQVGSKSRDSSVKRLVKQCQKHLDEESMP